MSVYGSFDCRAISQLNSSGKIRYLCLFLIGNNSGSKISVFDKLYEERILFIPADYYGI